MSDRSASDPLRPLTVAEVTELLGLGRETVLHLIRTGQIPALKAGNDFRVPRRCVEAYFENLAATAVPADPAVVSDAFVQPARRRPGRPRIHQGTS